MPVMRAIASAVLLSLSMTGAAVAQDEMHSRLSEDRVGLIEPGTYTAGEITFMISPYGDKYLLRFGAEPEIFVLYPHHAPLGGRFLKYDSGSTVLRVAGWGGTTLYTDDSPGGVPAEHSGEAFPPTLQPLTLAEMEKASQDESGHLAFSRNIHFGFTADWVALAGDAQMRALCFDAMENAGRGLDRFAASPAGRNVLMRRVETVRIALGNKPVIFMSGKTLNVTFNAKDGYAGRASSRGIARGLGQLFSVPIHN